MKIFLKFGSNSKKQFDINEDCIVGDLNGFHVKNQIETQLRINGFHLCSSNGLSFDLNKKICEHDTLIVYPKQLGGKVSDKSGKRSAA